MKEGRDGADTLPLGDKSYLTNLKKVSGPELTYQVIESAIVTFKAEVEILSEAIQHGDIDKIQKTSHALKGACYSTQSKRLAFIVSQIEKAAKFPSETKALQAKLEEIGSDTLAWWEKLKTDPDFQIK